MSSESVNILIKFNNEELGLENGTISGTMQEHLKVLSEKGKVIWGQGSDRIKQLAPKRVELVNKEINKRGYVYVFFVTSKNTEKTRDIFVGRCTKLYVKGDLSSYSEKIKYIPQYYSDKIGTDSDNSVALFELNEIVNIKENYLDGLYLQSNSEQQVMKVKNMNSLFYVTMKEQIEIELEKRFMIKDNCKNKLQKIEDHIYQEAISNEFSDKFQGVEESKGKYTTSGERYKRDPLRGKNAIINANYKCEVDGKHQFFISDVTGYNYVEAHHLIPMEYSELFNGINIDVEENIVSLCVVCHKKLHHGKFEDKIHIIKKIYNERCEGLRRKGISISLEEIINLYL